MRKLFLEGKYTSTKTKMTTPNSSAIAKLNISTILIVLLVQSQVVEFEIVAAWPPWEGSGL